MKTCYATFFALMLLGVTAQAVGQVTGYVIKTDGDVIYIDVGKWDRVDSGTVFVVHQVGGKEQMAEQIVGTVKVSQVFDRVSIGRFVAWQEGAQPHVLDRVTTAAGLPDATTPAIFTPIPVHQSSGHSPGIRHFLPGASQRAEGKHARAYMIIGGEVVTVIGGFLTYRSSNHLYDESRHASPLSAPRLYDRAKSRRRISNGLFAVAGGVYLYSVIDGFLGGAGKPPLIGSIGAANGIPLYNFHF